MSHVLNQFDSKLYAETLINMIVSDMAMSRWAIIHENRWALYELDYAEFVANFAFLVPESHIESTREDFEFLRTLVFEHWIRMDYAEVLYPPKYQVLGNYYVFEICFDHPPQESFCTRLK